jgi:ankyrin repeat protein
MEQPLLLAITNGRPDIVKDLVTQIGNPDYCPNEEDDEATLVYIAAQNGQVEVVRTLASLGADVNITNYLGASPVYVAAGNGHVDVIETLAELGADLHEPSHNGTTPLYVAAHEGQEDAVRALVKLGADPDEPNCHGITPLYIAAQEGHENVIRALAEVGTNLHFDNNASQYGSGLPPMMYIASQEGHIGVVRTLVELGGNVNVCRFDGTTPLHVASASQELEIINLLIERGGDVHAVMKNGATPMHLAAQEGHANVIRILAILGGDLDATNDRACTPAHIAASMGHVDALSTIIDMRGNVESLDSNDHSPLMTAAAFDQRIAFYALVNAGVDLRQCYYSRDLTLSVYSREIRQAVDHRNQSAATHNHCITYNNDKCCIFSLAKLMTNISRNFGPDWLSLSSGVDVVNTYRLTEEYDPASLHSLLSNVSARLRIQNFPYVIRRRLVHLAWKILEQSVAPLKRGDNDAHGGGGITAHAKNIRYAELVCLLLNEDMLRDVLALRMTCKSNCERRRFPVVCLSRCYAELEANLVEEWVAFGSSRFLRTNVIHGALAIHTQI